ncbi:HbrB-like-domain-containing protein [Delphinella strobiligena]|nr:HbrB-like-domain-containing protein [Delphinella strobiligena]
MAGVHIGHRARQHSQGFFEPSLPSSANGQLLGNLSASQIAAQAAYHPVQSGQQERKRSGGNLAPINTAASQAGRRVPSPINVVPAPTTATGTGPLAYSNGSVGGRHLAATTAANAAFPRSPLHSPNPQTADHHFAPTPTPQPAPQSSQPEFRSIPPPPAPPVPEPKSKERSKMNMKLFSKPKNIGITKDGDKKNPALPSPTRMLRAGFPNISTTSLADLAPSPSASSLYTSSANASTSTLVPANATGSGVSSEREKDKHRHHFLSRQKQKLKESAEHRNLPLSSASSNSQAVDPSAPQSLYSFAPVPSSPGFSKSVSGLDLRHGGRALREKKKEEKAAAAASASALTPIMSNSSANLSKYDDSRSEFIGPSSLDSASILGPATNMSSSVFSFPSLEQAPTISALAFSNLGATMGLTGITPDDAWPLLKARLLNIFEGEDLRTPIEDFNLLASVYVRRCIQKRAPIVLIEDLRELLVTGFSSLAQTLRGVPDERLVLKLVELWIAVFGTILPFIQAVFLPLDLEFRGQGSIMSQREAAEFWGAFMPEDSSKADERPSSSGGTVRLPSLGEELDVRRITLIVFRDVVVLPKHESLMAIFSRLSLDSIKTEPSPAMASTADFGPRSRGLSNPAISGAERPGTGGSLSPRLSSFNSQTSTLLDAASNSSGGFQGQTHSRSRATSNTSAGSFGTSLPHVGSPLSQPPMPVSGSFSPPTSAPPQPSPPVPIADPAHITETVARMLQCCSVLSGVQTADAGQGIIERLTQALKYNWLGRGRTGRQRRGWVGMKVGARKVGLGVVGA